MRRNRRPTPSMLVACAALILAVTGSAVAANRFLITKSSQIKPGAVAFKSLNKKARARLRGHAGAAGAPGAPGAAGESGPTGAAGPSGPTGPVGQAAVLGFAQGGGASLPGSPNVTVDTQSITTTKTSDLLVLFSAQSTVATCGAQDCSANGGLYMDSSGIFGTYEAFGAVTANTSKSHPSALSVIVPNVAAGQHTVTYAFSTSGPLTINHPDTSGHFTLIALNHG